MLEDSGRLGIEGACEGSRRLDSMMMVAAIIVKGLEIHRDAYTPLSMS